MAQPQTHTTQKLITFSNTLYAMAQKNAQKAGLSFQEYTRYLITKDAEEKRAIPFVDEETEKRIGESLEDYRNGRYTVIKTNKQLRDHLSALAKNA